jgi:hypothetical protein
VLTAAALPLDRPVERVAAVAFLLAAAAVVVVPLVGAGPRPVRPAVAVAAGCLVGFAGAAIVCGAGAGRGLECGAALAGFLLLLAGLSAAGARLLGGPVRGVAVSGLVGALLLASFHVGDPFLEWWGPRGDSVLAMQVLHAVNPLSGAVGSGLGLDWLRLPLLYRGFPGSGGQGLTAAPFYPFSYFPWWQTLLLHGGAGSGWLAVARGPFPFGRPRRKPKIRP